MVRACYVLEQECTSLFGEVLKKGDYVWADPEATEDLAVMCVVGPEMREFPLLRFVFEERLRRVSDPLDSRVEDPE